MADIDELLAKTSRTFAITIPVLPMPTRDEVGIAYLLFRIIDTFEDATRWPPAGRIEAIRQFIELLDDPDPARARRFSAECTAIPPIDHAGYLELLGEIPFVLSQLQSLSELSRHLVRAHVRRSAEGMIDVVSRAGPDRLLELSTVDELRRYCYVVAGIVGEMLTELFLLNRPQLTPAADYLRVRSRPFGEGLQLVNILKDAQADAREGRIYIPTARRAEVVELAHADLVSAAEYTLALQQQGGERGLVAFDALLVRLAVGTLAAMRSQRPGGKLTRTEVFGIVASVFSDIDGGRPALSVAGSDAYDLAAE
jgi:farnesyl-diphosphate farnesyltransferase